MTGRTLLILVFLAAALLMPGTALAQMVDLSPRFSPDEPHRFRVESESVVTRSIPDLDENLSQTTKLTYFLTRSVISAQDGTVLAELRFDRVVFATQAPNLLGELEDVVYDTGLRDPDTGEITGRAVLGRAEVVARRYADILDPLLGNAIALTLDANGTIRSIDLPEELGDAELFSVEMIRNRFLPLFQIHPAGGEHAIGTEWELASVEDSGLGFDVISTTGWTLESTDDGAAAIGIENSFSTGEVRRDTGITLRESSGSGRVEWNTRLGVLQSLTSAQAIRMAGIPQDMGVGRVELRVRSRLEIHRSPEPWSIESQPGPDKESEKVDPDTD
jgi:hypothetical protein